MKRIASIILLACISGAPLSAQESEPVFFDGQQDSTVALPYAQIDKDRVVGAVSTVTGEQLSHTGRNSVNVAMMGQAAGLYVLGGSTSPGSASATWKIRGLSRGNSNDGPLVVVDGMNNRDLSSITIEEIESIQVLKDVTAKMLYGSKAANGVIMITTKRGEGKRKYTFDVEYGTKIAQNLPEYLDSYSYASLYNQALANDGLDPLYSQEALDGYAAQPGDDNYNPLKYPNVDFYDEFMETSSSFYRANVQAQGKEGDVGYFLNVGYYGEDGLQKVGDNQMYNRLNVRSNLDYKVNDIISAHLDIAARWDLTSRPNMAYNDYISAMATTTPLNYAVFAGAYGDTDSLGYGTSDNLYGELTKSGYTEDQTALSQTNIGLDFDFNRYVAGLTAKVFLSYDVMNFLSKGKSYTYSRIRLNDDGTLERVGDDVVKGEEQKFSDDTWRNFGGTAQLNYVYAQDEHEFLANAVFNIQQKSYKTVVTSKVPVQDDKGITNALRLNYAYDNRYVIELDGTILGSDRFIAEERWGTFGAAGAAWNIANEAFMEDVDFVNDLKLKASYGLMGYDGDFDDELYKTFYGDGGTYRTGVKNAITEYGYQLQQIGNESLTFEKSRELNIGIEGRLLDNRLSFEANYFDEYRYDMPVIASTQIPDWVGLGTTTDDDGNTVDVFPTLNYNAVSNKGFEVAVNWADQIGDFRYQIGGSVTHSEAIYEQLDEAYDYEHLYRVGTAVDAMYGFKTDGLYQNQSEIDEHGVTSSFGTIRPGDVKLLEYIEDGTIDAYDKVILGNSFPRYYTALNINMEYKGFSLYVLGQGVSGYDRFFNSAYFVNGSSAKYSVNAEYAAVYDPETDALIDGYKYPRLATVSSQSGQGSDFWINTGAYAKIRTVQLAYDFNANFCKSFGAQGLQIYLKGDDLCSYTPISDLGLDPENLNAGITGNPMFTTLSVGVKLMY